MACRILPASVGVAYISLSLAEIGCNQKLCFHFSRKTREVCWLMCLFEDHGKSSKVPEPVQGHMTT